MPGGGTRGSGPSSGSVVDLIGPRREGLDFLDFLLYFLLPLGPTFSSAFSYFLLSHTFYFLILSTFYFL